QVAGPLAAKPVTHVGVPTLTQHAALPIFTVKLVLGARPVKLPVRVTVVPAAPPLRMIELPPGVSEKVKLPLPPSTCLVTTIWPLWGFENAGRHGAIEPRPVATAVHVAKPAGTKSELAASVTVYVPGARPLNVAVPLPATVLPVVEIVADIVTPPGPVSVKLNVPLPPVVFLVTTTEPMAWLVKLQVGEPPGPKLVTQTVGPTAVKPAGTVSLTV